MMDCALVHEVCGGKLRAINHRYLQQAERLVQNYRNAASCTVEEGITAKVACVGGVCLTVPDENHCLLHHANGACEISCTIMGSNGACQHTCTEGIPCD
jgi:hypothetical protein